MLLGRTGGAITTLPGQTLFDCVLAPLLAANQDNYTFGAAAEATQIGLFANTAINITGIAGAQQGRVKILSVMPGSSTITFKNNSGASLAANRMTLGGDVAVAAGSSIALVCLDPANGWRLLFVSTLTGGGGGGTVTEIDTGPGLSGGPITASGSLLVAFVPSVNYSPGATVNNAAPAGFSAATSRLLVTPNAGGTTLTGLVSTGFTDGQPVLIVNVSGADNLTLNNADTNSSAANRFKGAGNIVLVPGEAMLIALEGTGWRMIG